jgi:VWFA-related protein
MRACRPNSARSRPLNARSALECTGLARFLCALLVSSMPTAGAGQAQTKAAPTAAGARPTFRVDSELVMVDLVPTDRNERFVDDLRSEEVRITEDGQPRPVQFLELVRVGRPGLAATPVSDISAAAPTTGPEPATRETGVLAVVIDLQGTPQETMPRLVEGVKVVLAREIPEGTPMLLATVWHGLSVRQPFTTDRARFIAALEKVTSPSGSGSALQQLADDIAKSGMSSREALGVARALILELARERDEVSQSLAALARSLAGIPGRKHVVVYSTGHAIQPTRALAELFQSRFGAVPPDLAVSEIATGLGEVQRLVDDANRSQVSLYTVDPMGLQSDLIDATFGGSVSRLALAPAGQGLRHRNIRELQEYLRTLAGDTGGRAFVNTNDAGRGLRRAWVDAREYYLVGFVPSEGKRDGFRRIKLTVARRGLDLRYRRGYWREDAPRRTDRDIVLATRLPGLFADGDLSVEAHVADGSLHVTSLLRATALTFAEREGRQHCAVSIQAFLGDASGRLVGGRGLFAMDVDMHLSPSEFEALRASPNVEVPARAPAPPSGMYQLLVVARHSGARITTHTQEIVVP